MSFAQRAGVRAMIENFPAADATRAYERMKPGAVRFRSVPVMN